MKLAVLLLFGLFAYTHATWTLTNNMQISTNGWWSYFTANGAGTSGCNNEKNLYAASTDPNVFGTNTLHAYWNSGANSAVSGRLVSINNQFRQGIYIFDIAHFPSGGSTNKNQKGWPAIWMLSGCPCGSGCSNNWPAGGEIDILESAFDAAGYYLNKPCLHTGGLGNFAQYTYSWNSVEVQPYTGHDPSCGTCNQNCDYRNGANPEGCWWVDPRPEFSYDQLNNGGYVALRWDSTGIYVYVWPRNAAPSDVSGGTTPNPSGWDTSVTIGGITFPHYYRTAYYPESYAPDMDNFDYFNLVIEIKLCGDFVKNSGQSTCQPLSTDNYSQMYWAINSIKYWKDI